MKLPKHFGGQGFQGMMSQLQQGMAKAKDLEAQLAEERIEVDRGPVKATFSGAGELIKISIDKSVVDPEDVEALEDLIVGVVRDGFTQTTELRNKRVQEIMPNVPGL